MGGDGAIPRSVKLWSGRLGIITFLCKRQARVHTEQVQHLHSWRTADRPSIYHGVRVTVLPRSGNEARIQENANLFDFELSELDMRLLGGLVALSETIYKSPLAPAW